MDMALFEALSCLTAFTVVQCGTITSDMQKLSNNGTSDDVTVRNMTPMCNFTHNANLQSNTSDACANDAIKDCSNISNNREECFINAWEAFNSKLRTINASIAACSFLIFISLFAIVTSHRRKIFLLKNKWQFRYKRKEFEDNDDIFIVENDNTLMSYGSVSEDGDKTRDDRDTENDGLVEVNLDTAEMTV